MVYLISCVSSVYYHCGDCHGIESTWYTVLSQSSPVCGRSSEEVARSSAGLFGRRFSSSAAQRGGPPVEHFRRGPAPPPRQTRRHPRNAPRSRRVHSSPSTPFHYFAPIVASGTRSPSRSWADSSSPGFLRPIVRRASPSFVHSLSFVPVYSRFVCVSAFLLSSVTTR